MTAPSPHDAPAEAPAPEWSRRSFLKLLALGGLGTAWSLSSCRSPGQYIVPYKNAPEWSLPGKPTLYATSAPMPWGVVPVLATSHEGRPTMLEANREHPGACGCPSWTTAALWDLYSPDRSRRILYRGKKVAEGEPIGPAEFAGAFRAWSKRVQDKASVALVTETPFSPSFQSLADKLRGKNPQVTVYRDDSLTPHPLFSAREVCTEIPARPVFRPERAVRLLSLDRDFIGLEPVAPLEPFFRQRTAGGETPANRLYVIEGQLTLTGGMADNRLAVKPDAIPLILSFLAKKIAQKTNHAVLAALLSPEGDTTSLPEETKRWLTLCLDDLLSCPGQSLILLGDRYAPALHALCLAVNDALGANRPSATAPLSLARASAPAPKALSDLKEDLKKGKTELLFWMSPGNPLHSRPDAEEWKELFRSSGATVIHLGLYADDTAHASDWHIPAAHFLESWGDDLDANGVLSLRQPLSLPLFGGVSDLELLLGLLSPSGRLTTADTARGNLSPAYAAVKAAFQKRTGALDKERAWNEALKRGFLLPEKSPGFLPLSPGGEALEDLSAKIKKALEQAQALSGAPVLLLANDFSLLDGRYINNPWLEECPDPVTRLTWGNAALMSPATRDAIQGGHDKNALRITRPGGTPVTLPLQLVPGMAEGLVALPRGYGQTHTGLVGRHCGVNAAPLFQGTEGLLSAREIRLELIPLPGGTPEPALVQQEGNEPARHADLFPASLPAVPLPAPGGSDPLHQWGLCIDLSKCTGCQACVVACLAENNIPVVGREQAAKGRLMHWLHIDRYFPENADSLLFLPRACQQCENAPCESVCPLAATAHTEDGLNAMAYSRCVGTRYCANNCPYKVRRFNYFDYNKYNPYLPGNLARGPLGETQTGAGPHLQKNPNVTVRMRGVMEKCSYCVQRIEAAKIRQKRAVQSLCEQTGEQSSSLALSPEDLRIPADSFQCACQAACPAGAITFGNLLDKHAAVHHQRSSPRAYTLLHSLGVLPRTAYLLRVRNPHPGLTS